MPAFASPSTRVSDPTRRPAASRSVVRHGVACVAACFVGVQSGGAQVAAVDEGSFAITHAGVAVGREEFRIMRQPVGGGVAFVARGVAAYGARRITPALQADSSGGPLRYQVEVRGAGLDERVSAQGGVGGRFSAQVQHGAREGAREYLLSAGTVVADDEVYHQLYFLARHALAGATSVPVLVPRTDAQLTVRITRAGPGPVTIGGRALPATHYLLADARSTWRREIWIDSEARILRVVVPALGLDVLRDDPPR